MSAETLRRAAALIRKRARTVADVAVGLTVLELREEQQISARLCEHLQPWGYHFPLALADLLEHEAQSIDQAFNPDTFVALTPRLHYALAVARAYLGEA